MKEQLLIAFPACEKGKCLETLVRAKFDIFDKEGERCYVRKSGDEPIHFAIENPNQKEVNFLAIDGCLFGSGDGKRCDCAVFDDKTFCWIEIKDTNPKQRSGNRKTAIGQLKATISLFKSKVDMSSYQLEAHMCLGVRKVYPAVSAQNQSAVKEFFDELKTDLLEGNQKTFS